MKGIFTVRKRRIKYFRTMCTKVSYLTNRGSTLIFLLMFAFFLFYLDRTPQHQNDPCPQGQPRLDDETSDLRGREIDTNQLLRSGNVPSGKEPSGKEPSGKGDGEFFEDVKGLFSVMDRYKMPSVDCQALFKGDKKATQDAYGMRETLNKNKKAFELTENYFIEETRNCRSFLETRGYITSPLSKEEEEFPIAYSIVAYKTIEMVERLLRAIYRPQNVYCIHVDIRAKQGFFESVKALANCFPNVHLSPKRFKVVRNEFSMVECELECMKFLSQFKKWRYLINLTGQEFPLQTNARLVQILKIYNGTNDIYGTVKESLKRRWKGLHPPKGVRLTKGQVHVVASRGFIEFMLHDRKSLALMNFTKRTEVADETFFSTLNNNPQLGTPGAYTGNLDLPSMTQMARFKNWNYFYPCAGRKLIHHICVLTLGDLPILAHRPEFFANKFFLEEDRVVIGCMEELHFNRTLMDYVGHRPFNETFYRELDFVKHHQ